MEQTSTQLEPDLSAIIYYLWRQAETKSLNGEASSSHDVFCITCKLISFIRKEHHMPMSAINPTDTVYGTLPCNTEFVKKRDYWAYSRLSAELQS